MDTPRVSGLDLLGSIEIRHEYLMKPKPDNELRKNLAETRAINNADERDESRDVNSIIDISPSIESSEPRCTPENKAENGDSRVNNTIDVLPADERLSINDDVE